MRSFICDASRRDSGGSATASARTYSLSVARPCSASPHRNEPIGSPRSRSAELGGSEHGPSCPSTVRHHPHWIHGPRPANTLSPLDRALASARPVRGDSRRTPPRASPTLATRKPTEKDERRAPDRAATPYCTVRVVALLAIEQGSKPSLSQGTRSVWGRWPAWASLASRHHRLHCKPAHRPSQRGWEQLGTNAGLRRRCRCVCKPRPDRSAMRAYVWRGRVTDIMYHASWATIACASRPSIGSWLRGGTPGRVHAHTCAAQARQ
ncbi:hypothetical protein PYCCODRAFT_321341 [Trametes coccinea BRFM310]|uniref:Uncharacterized protein n=1 Tax=Trametes coccinea (strain BRFM310) TaxID=1353009 RepID=A0A1Y2IPM7_TRAC3|nr:hypothetical protein PYCCODRAFT_321341 [Trametes coccinea BRFM310]